MHQTLISNDNIHSSGIFKDLLKIAPSGIVIADKDGKITYANKKAQKILNLTIDEVSKRCLDSSSWKVKDIKGKPIGPKDFPFYKAKHFLKIIEDEILLITSKDEEKYLSLNTTPLFDKDKNFNGVIQTIVDVTHDVVARNKLTESEERYRGLFQQMKSAVVVYIYDEDKKDFLIKEFNVAAEKFEKIRSDKVIGKYLTKVFPGVKNFGLFDTLVKVYKTGKPIHFPIAQYKDERISGWRDNYIYKLFSGEVVAIYEDVTEEKKLEFELKKSQKSLSTLMSNLPGMAYRCKNDKNWTMLFVSDGCKDLTGYDTEEIINNKVISYNEVIHPEDRSYVGQKVKEALKKDSHFEIEYRIVNKKGIIKHVWEKGIHLENNNNGGVIEGFITDITDRVKVEKLLSESENKYRNLVERANDGILMVQDYLITYVNGKLLKMLGYKEDEVLNADFRKLLPKSEKEKIERNYKDRMIGKDIPPVYETQLAKKNGEIIDVEFNAGLTEYNGKLANMVIIRDISERKLAEELILKSEEKYRSLVERANDGIVIVQDSILKFVNNRFPVMLGYKENEILNKSFSEILAESEKEKVEKRYEERMAGKMPPPIYETKLEKKNGEILDVEFNAGLIDFNDKVADLVVVRDISERKHALEKIEGSERRFRRIFESSPDGIMVLEGNSLKILDLNPQFLEMFRFKREQLIGKKLNDIKLFDDTLKNSDIIPRLDGKEFVKFDRVDVQISKDNFIQVEAIIISYNEGEKNFVQCNLRDISERIRSEEKMKELLDELEKTNSDLTKLNKFMIGREVRMRELKQEIKSLKSQNLS